MTAPPDFFHINQTITAVETFKPSPPSRRTEGLAWVAAGVVTVSAAFAYARTGELSFLSILILILFLGSALTISFGNWIDRGTSIQIDAATVHYRSPLRDIEFQFDQIEMLFAIPAAGGWRILVRGADRYFQFRTQISLRKGEGERLSVGIENGERLAGLIRSQAGLSAAEEQEGAWLFRRP